MPHSRKKLAEFIHKGEQECAIETALSIIGGKWKMRILKFLRDDPKRYGELKRLTKPITEKMLIGQLRELQADGIVYRKVFAEIPPHVQYGLTPLGKDLNKVFQALDSWGSAFIRKAKRKKNL
jgi:DNA-binding HxlR family transcriptional regulator